MTPVLQLLIGTTVALAVSSPAHVDRIDRPQHSLLLVIGAPGEDQYGEMFLDWADKWRAVADAAGAKITVIGEDGEGATDRDRLVAELRRQAETDCELFWLVLIGHGTFDGHAAKFNLRGPDFTAEELGEWLAPIDTRTVVINCASSSAPFINALAAKHRIIITAAKSGYEMNFARFGHYLAGAIDDPRADLDKDDQVSLLEAYLAACRQVAEFYDEDARLATEHALLDDNGDGLGTPADWFRGVRATQRTKEGAELDGARAHQVHLVPSDREARLPAETRQRRDALEIELARLRDRKADMQEDAYLDELASILLKLARIYQEAEIADGRADDAPSDSETPADQ